MAHLGFPMPKKLRPLGTVPGGYGYLPDSEPECITARAALYIGEGSILGDQIRVTDRGTWGSVVGEWLVNGWVMVL